MQCQYYACMLGVSTIQKTKAMLCAIPTFHTYLNIQVNIKREVVCVAQHKMFRYSAKEYLIPAKTMMEDKLVWIICYDSGLSISSIV